MRGLMVVAALLCAASASAQQRPPLRDPAIPGADQPSPTAPVAETIAAVRKAIATHYVFADKRAALDAALAKGLASGRYAVAEPQELGRRLTEDLFAVAQDKHLGLRFHPEFAAELARNSPAGHGDAIDDSPFFRAFARKRNHGVAGMRVLPGNIRLVTYEGFVWTGPDSARAIDAAVAFLRDGDAAILDLRGNGGGSPDAVRHLVSYLVPANTPLIAFHMPGGVTRSATGATPPGPRLAAPLYVLTSGRSASAAEEFVSHVARLRLATLVGEATAGAANRNDEYPIPGGFVLSVSVGYPELPEGGNWEGKGVAPAIAVPAPAALDRALQAVALMLAAKAQGPERTELEWAATLYGARVTPITPSRALDRYAGRYGPRLVAVENGRLTFQRDGGIKSALVAIGADLFALEADPRSRIRFTIAGEAVTGMEIERADGSRIAEPRT